MSATSLFGLKLSDIELVLVGGGEVSLSKLHTLISGGSKPIIIAPQIHNEIKLLACEHGLKIHQREWQRDDSKLGTMFVLAISDAKQTISISRYLRQHQKIVVSVDRAKDSNCYFVASVKRGSLVVGITTDGVAPSLARHLRLKIDQLLAHHLDAVVKILSNYRSQIKQSFPNLRIRRDWYEQLIKKLDCFNPAKTLTTAEVSLEITNALKQTITNSKQGKFILVGAGPGSSDYLTVRAVKEIQQADVVLYDSLVSHTILNHCRKDGLLINTGKRSGLHRYKQDDINQLILEQVRQDRLVVRLKGGDPLLFSRASEEIHFSRKHNIDVEVVPGISSYQAMAASLPAAYTHRELADSMLLTCYSEDRNQSWWDTVSRNEQTVVLFMATRWLGMIFSKMIKLGKDENTPYVIYAGVGCNNQCSFNGVLADSLAKTSTTLDTFIASCSQKKLPLITMIGKILDLPKDNLIPTQ